MTKKDVGISIIILIGIIGNLSTLYISDNSMLTPMPAIRSGLAKYQEKGTSKYMKIAREIKNSNSTDSNLAKLQYIAIKEEMEREGVHVNYAYIDEIIKKVNEN